MAAQREGMKTLIFPYGNKDDVEALPDYIKQGLTFHFTEDYVDNFRICFPDVKVDSLVK
jgi:ATP-dependent Lon protease